MNKTVTILYSGNISDEKKKQVLDHLSKFGVEVNLVESEEYYKENNLSLTFDKCWIDEAYTVCEEFSESEKLNKPYGPQPKGKKGKVRKW